MERLDHISIINLDHRRDRWFFCEAQIHLYNLKKWTRFPAVLHADGVRGCTLSHIGVLVSLMRHSSFSTSACYLILEDDFFFTLPRARLDSELQPFLTEHLSSWDVLLLSSTWHKPMGSSNATKPLRRVSESYSTCAYVIKGWFVPFLLEAFRTGLQKNTPVDVAWSSLMSQHRFLLPHRLLVIQLNNQSSITHSIHSYQRHESLLWEPAGGGLGTRLFEMATIVSLGLQLQKLIYIDQETTSGGRHHRLFNTFEAMSLTKFRKTFPLSNHLVVSLQSEPPLGRLINGSYIVKGHLRTLPFLETITRSGWRWLDLLKIPKEIEKTVDTLYTYWRNRYPREPLFAVHVRRKRKFHQRTPFIDLLQTRYYQRAIERIKREFEGRFLLFSDDPRHLQKHPHLKGTEMAETGNDVVSLLLMSRLDGIITSNSNFGWWSAYLNRQKKPIVLRPLDVSHSVSQTNHEKEYPPSWIPIPCFDTTIVLIYNPLLYPPRIRQECQETWMPHLLKVRTPMVIFTTSQWFPYFRALRAHATSSTQLESLPNCRQPESFESMTSLDRFDAVRHKVGMLNIAASKNVFKTNMFVAVDPFFFQAPLNQNYANWPDSNAFRHFGNNDKVFLAIISKDGVHHELMGGSSKAIAACHSLLSSYHGKKPTASPTSQRSAHGALMVVENEAFEVIQPVDGSALNEEQKASRLMEFFNPSSGGYDNLEGWSQYRQGTTPHLPRVSATLMYIVLIFLIAVILVMVFIPS